MKAEQVPASRIQQTMDHLQFVENWVPTDKVERIIKGKKKKIDEVDLKYNEDPEYRNNLEISKEILQNKNQYEYPHKAGGAAGRGGQWINPDRWKGYLKDQLEFARFLADNNKNFTNFERADVSRFLSTRGVR